MTKRPERLVLCNDDGWIGRETNPPLTVAQLRDKIVATYRGSPVGALLWCVGDHEVYEYETEVGERFGEAFDIFDDPRDRLRAENLRHLIDECGGPLTALTRLSHEAGLDFFPSVRMNSHYVIAESSPGYGRFRRERPDLLIGQPGEEIPRPSVEWGIRTGLDYKFREVRAHMARIIIELFERFDVDGVELDFMRHPAFFRPEEAYANRYLMTDLVRRIRRRMDEVGADRGKHLDLAVRVPPTLSDSARIGLDSGVWIREGLIDIVEVGAGFIPFEMPLAEFVRAAQGTGCRVYGAIEAMRWALDEEVLNALASRFWDAGASGIYLFNFFNLPNEWKRRVLGRMADRGTLARLNKRYELDHTDTIASKEGHIAAFRYAIPAAQLPVVLEETLSSVGAVLKLEIADDVDAAVADGFLDSCVLALGFENLGEGDQMEVRLNGASLSWSSAAISRDGWSHLEFRPDRRTDVAQGLYMTPTHEVTVEGTRAEFEVACPPLKRGINRIEVVTTGPRGSGTGPPVLKDVALSISYRQAAGRA